jgi:hypothetical protein
MLTKNAGWISAATSLALAASLAGCSGGGSGGSFHVSTCSLGCSGQGGGQILCGVVGIAENQEVTLLFTSPVDPGSISKESFVVREAVGGASAAGSRFVDPTNPNRLIFRPKLTIGPAGETIFGFESGKSYEVYLNGTVQKDPKPFVESADGRENETRVACTVQASQGIVDTIPGKPSASVFVTVEQSGGSEAEVELLQGQVPGATEVKTFSSVVIEFDELMDISSILDPSTGIAPGIDVLLDLDGNIATTNDRAQIEGSFTFGFDQNAQTTSLAFTPTTGFPSLGADAGEPRLVVVVLDDGIQDIAGNGLDQPGTYNFVPQQIAYPAVTLPPGGEQFVDQANLDAPVSGSPWGTDVAGRLTPGEGGGSGRHGELHVAAGQTLVLHSSGAKASAEIEFTAIPLNLDKLTIGGVSFVFRTNPVATNPLHVPIRYSLTYTVSSLVEVIRAYAAANPTSQVATATYTQSDLATVRVEAIAEGIPAPAYVLLVEPNLANPPYAELSSGTLTGGFVEHTFTGTDLVTNFDFDAGTGTPGGKPADLVVDDGVFEFSRVVIEPTATVLLTGSNPVRLLVRGDFELADLALIDLSGEDAGQHNSTTPFGQPGAAAGPNAGSGGKGGDRSSQPALAVDDFGAAVTLENPDLDGSDGLGVGGVAAQGEGLGGVRYPAEFPDTTAPVDYKGWAHGFNCTSGMMANTGSGGAYSLPGVRGQTKVVEANGTSTLGEVSNKPIDNTLGGSAAQVGLEPASANPTGNRLLSPGVGDLRGGSGGGGAGAHVGSTQTDLFGSNCFGNDFFIFSDNSGAGGGGGGGALQIQAGGTLALQGQVDAGGGAGGSSAVVATINGSLASPGGGASGGAVLVQGGTLELAQQPSRILVDGGAAGTGGYLLVPSLAGPGSPGIVRVEQRGSAPDATLVAASTFPTDPLDPTSVKWLSAGAWAYNFDLTDEFESVTGSQSCWMQVIGSHFSLTLLDDPAAPAAPEDMGWNMDVILDLGAGEITVPWRGSDGNGPFLGLYPEEYWGTLLNRDLELGQTGAPIVVRFQAAATSAPLNFPCEVDPDDPNGPFEVGSVTPWVRQPRELNDFVPLPTVVRFLVLFDRSHPDFDSEFPVFIKIKGVTNLRIEAQPE